MAHSSFFAPLRAATGGGGPRFFISSPRVESVSRRSQGSAPDPKECGGAWDGAIAKAHQMAHWSSLSRMLPCVQGELPRGRGVQVPRWQHYSFFFLFSLQCTGCLLRERPIFIRKSPPQPLAGAISNQPEILAKCKPHVTCIHTKPEADGCRQRPKPTRQGHNTHTHGLGMTPLELALRISTNTKIFRLLLYKILHRQKRAQFYAGFKGSYYTAPVSALHNGTLVLPSTMSIL